MKTLFENHDMLVQTNSSGELFVQNKNANTGLRITCESNIFKFAIKNASVEPALYGAVCGLTLKKKG